MKGVLEKCPDKNATLEYSIKTTLISANAGQADCLSQMSEVLSNIDSGPESEYDFQDFLKEEGTDGTRSQLDRIRRRINGGAGARASSEAKGSSGNILKTSIKQSADPTRPPLMLGRHVA